MVKIEQQNIIVKNAFKNWRMKIGVGMKHQILAKLWSVENIQNGVKSTDLIS